MFKIIFPIFLFFIFSINAVALHCPRDYYGENVILNSGDSRIFGVRVQNQNGVKIKLEINIEENYSKTILMNETEYVLDNKETVPLLFNITINNEIPEGKHIIYFNIMAEPIEDLNKDSMVGTMGNCCPLFIYEVKEKDISSNAINNFDNTRYLLKKIEKNMYDKEDTNLIKNILDLIKMVYK
jgi:hypothetical protein